MQPRVNGSFEGASYSGNSNPDDDSHSSKYAAASASLALRNITSLRRPGGSSLAALRASLAASNSRTLSGCSCLRRLRLLMRLPFMRARYQSREGPHLQASMPRVEKSSSRRPGTRKPASDGEAQPESGGWSLHFRNLIHGFPQSAADLMICCWRKFALRRSLGGCNSPSKRIHTSCECRGSSRSLQHI